MDYTIDGSRSLEEQQRSAHFEELRVPCKLLSLKKGDKPKNIASFEDAELGEDIPDLVLVIVSPADTIEAITEKQKAAGRKLIFSSTAFVRGEEATVAGFR